jgi:DNA polymerase alpha subunit B
MNLDEDIKPKMVSSHSRVALAIGTDPRTWNYRYMFERPGIKGQALDDGLEEMTKAIQEAYNLSREDIADPSVTAQESVYIVGRISPLLTREDKTPKLTDGMIIEASRAIGSGSRTPLRFSSKVIMRGLPTKSGGKIMHTGGNGRQIGLFPGMIAGFKGRNGGGDGFVVEEVLLPPALPLPASVPSDLYRFHFAPSALDGDSLQIQVASGPYTSDDNLDFTPWHQLMNQVEKQKPDVILLLGPFLSAQHSSLMDPGLTELPQDIFQRHISKRLNRLCELTSRTTAILLPSTKDIVSLHAAWPQPMFDKASLGIHKRVKCLPNPCLFSINEIVLGATTADVLRDLRGQEMVMDVASDIGCSDLSGEKDRDGMSRTVRQLFHQRHFYPLLPTPSDVPLDITHSKLAAFPSVTPDVLLLPSVLAPFARVVDGAVVVNPGSCAKGSTLGRGSFATMQIQSLDREDLQQKMQSENEQEDVKVSHQVYNRARVDVFRI